MPKGYRGSVHLHRAQRQQWVVDALGKLHERHRLLFTGHESEFADGIGEYCQMCHRLIAVRGAHVGDDTYIFTYNKGTGRLCIECERRPMVAMQPVPVGSGEMVHG